MRSTILLMLAWLGLVGPAWPGPTQEERPAVVLVDPPFDLPLPVIDGVVDEAIWSRVAEVAPLRQVVPVSGGQPSQRTEVRVFVAENSLWIGAICFDDHPELIRATVVGRDMRLNPDDNFGFTLDPFEENRDSYGFLLGAAGGRNDGKVLPNGDVVKDWNPIWEGEVRITARGWEVEIRLPFESIEFPPGSTSWAFNVRRQIPREKEEIRWTGLDPKFDLFHVARAGRLENVHARQGGLGLDLTPFLVAEFDKDRTGGSGWDSDFDVGIDGTYRITPNVRFSLSIHTDFAEAEADQRQVNLTRFPLFFPEKRDFFVEDENRFALTTRPASELDGPESTIGHDFPILLPYFSRRIGLRAAPRGFEEVPLLGAAKVSGRTHRTSFGLLGAVPEDTDDPNPNQLLVGRVSTSFFEQSSVGLLATYGDPDGLERNGTYGADFSLRTDHFRETDRLQLSGFVLGTDGDDVDQDGLAYQFDLEYPNDEVELGASYTVIDPDFDPALGFVQRPDIKAYRADAYWRPRPHSETVRQYEFGVTPILLTDTDGETKTVDIRLQPFAVTLESDDEAGLSAFLQREVLDEPFRLSDEVEIPPGAYTFVNGGAYVASSQKRPVSGALRLNAGEYFDGDRFDALASVRWAPSSVFVLDASYDWADIDVPAGATESHTARLRGNLQFSPDLTWLNLVQYDNTSQVLGVFSRLGWVPTSGNELFLVVNQSWEYEPHSLVAGDTQVVVKLGYTLRL